MGEATRPCALQTCGLTKRFGRPGQAELLALSDVSLCVERGERVAVVGGSGCGKSTLAKLVCGLMEPTSGKVLLSGTDPRQLRGARRRELTRRVQMVFQNPVSSFDPRRTLGDGVCEPLRNLGMGRAQAGERALALLEGCGLDAEVAHRYPHEVSGGQCQRAAIARALAPDPALLVCDEATSALDVTVQAKIVGLLEELTQRRGMALLFICHDLALVQGISDRVVVLEGGRVVEEGPTGEVMASPRHPYTRALLDAALD